MTKASWNDMTIAESDDCIALENFTYFPADSVNHALLRRSDRTSTCSWKGGSAVYYDLIVGDAVNQNAVWCYPETGEAAKPIAGWYAFWRGVEIDGADKARPFVKPAL
jgi:uncharacterized protein (DUF427 family)